jgi:hypothetical protein
VQLIDRLLTLADLWTVSRGLSLSRLGTLVLRDGSFFDRVAGGASCTIATFEKFLAHFRNPQNWAEGFIPDDARALLDDLPPHAAPDTAEAAAVSSGNGDKISGEDAQGHEWPVAAAGVAA